MKSKVNTIKIVCILLTINFIVCLIAVLLNANTAYAIEPNKQEYREVDGITYQILGDSESEFAEVVDCKNPSENITIPSEIVYYSDVKIKVTEINSKAFSNCVNTLKTLIIPESVKDIGSSIFNTWSNPCSIQNVIFEGSKPLYCKEAFHRLTFNLYYDINKSGWDNKEVQLGGATQINYMPFGKDCNLKGRVLFNNDMPSVCNVDLVDLSGNVLIGDEFCGDHISGIWFNFENVKSTYKQFKLHVYNKEHSYYTDTFTIMNDMEFNILVS